MTEEVNMATVQLSGDKQNFILDKKIFSTGSKGSIAKEKWSLAAKYQINIQVVEIGSKPKEK
jgi:hypothetical protein